MSVGLRCAQDWGVWSCVWDHRELHQGVLTHDPVMTDRHMLWDSLSVSQVDQSRSATGSTGTGPGSKAWMRNSPQGRWHSP